MKTYIINLEKRTDRYAKITSEFIGHPEFECEIVRPVEDDNGPQSLFKTVQSLCEKEIERKSKCFLIVEDDHKFTSAYNAERFGEAIKEADALGAYLLLGGVIVKSNFDFKYVSENLFQLEFFNATQFMVVFRRFYDIATRLRLHINLAQDQMFSIITNNSYVTVPFISYQYDTDYSDCTVANAGRSVAAMFAESEKKMLHTKRMHEGGFFPLG